MCEAVGAAVAAEDNDVLDALVGQAEAYHGATGGGRAHGFVEWLAAVQEGWAALPERIPRVVLLAWLNGQASHPGGDSPIPRWRCEDCKMVLPNATPDGNAPRFEVCPVCDSGRIFQMALWAAWGSTWLPVDGGYAHVD